MRRCALIRPGVVGYEQGLIIQAEARRRVADGEYDGMLILLEHPPVITLGRSGGEDNLRVSRDALVLQGVPVVNTNRGGKVTCHNPGQLVGYPVQDVHWFVSSLEEVIIRTLLRYGHRCGRKADYTGVWLGNEKIAAIGISVRQWITNHGFALNVTNDLSLFENVIPCGIREFGVTSLKQAGTPITVSQTMETLKREFGEVFECRLIEL